MEEAKMKASPAKEADPTVASTATTSKSRRPIFGSLARIVAEEFGKNTVSALRDGLHNMPAAESPEPMHEYIERVHMQVVDLFDIFVQRSVCNPHFIMNPNQRERVAEIFHDAVDAQTIREAIRKKRRQQQEEEGAETEENDLSAKNDGILPDAVPTENELENLKETIQQLALRQEELEKKRSQLQSSTTKISSCETLLQDMEQSTASAVDSADIERVRSMLVQAQTLASLRDKAQQEREEMEEIRKRKGGGGGDTNNGAFVVPKQRKKRASFGTRYGQSIANVDAIAMATIINKIFNDGK